MSTNPFTFHRVDSALLTAVGFYLQQSRLVLPEEDGEWVTLTGGSKLFARASEDTGLITHIDHVPYSRDPADQDARIRDNRRLRSELAVLDRHVLRAHAQDFVEVHANGFCLADLVHSFNAKFVSVYGEYLTGLNADFGDALIRDALNRVREAASA